MEFSGDFPCIEKRQVPPSESFLSVAPRER